MKDGKYKEYWWRNEEYYRCDDRMRREIDMYQMNISPIQDKQMKNEFLVIIIIFGLIGLIIGIMSL